LDFSVDVEGGSRADAERGDGFRGNGDKVGLGDLDMVAQLSKPMLELEHMRQNNKMKRRKEEKDSRVAAVL
jgi:hypothetical protein